MFLGQNLGSFWSSQAPKPLRWVPWWQQFGDQDPWHPENPQIHPLPCRDEKSVKMSIFDKGFIHEFEVGQNIEIRGNPGWPGIRRIYEAKDQDPCYPENPQMHSLPCRDEKSLKMSVLDKGFIQEFYVGKNIEIRGNPV